MSMQTTITRVSGRAKRLFFLKKKTSRRPHSMEPTPMILSLQARYTLSRLLYT